MAVKALKLRSPRVEEKSVLYGVAVRNGRQGIETSQIRMNPLPDIAYVAVRNGRQGIETRVSLAFLCFDYLVVAVRNGRQGIETSSH